MINPHYTNYLNRDEALNGVRMRNTEAPPALRRIGPPLRIDFTIQKAHAPSAAPLDGLHFYWRLVTGYALPFAVRHFGPLSKNKPADVPADRRVTRSRTTNIILGLL